MKTKAHILVVEDKSLIYKRLKMILTANYYSVDDYAPSVKKAIGLINKKRPDLVLLDIDLQGDHNGIYLGNLLKTQYNIPFIYVTDFDDDQTFYKSLETNHSDFISKKQLQLHDTEIIQTKPHLDEKRLIRSIQTALNSIITNIDFTKEGIMGLVSYLDKIREMDKSRVTRVPVSYKDILFFTVKPFINENEEQETLRANYLWFQTLQNDYFFLKTSLKDLQKKLPYNFIRVNESYIVNIEPKTFTGRINGSKLSIGNKEIIIKNTYKAEVEKRLKLFYN
ncbi:hypothetical protein BWZ20_10230 [Winogradskyella sp. J14-2]|uniref:response regulator transcription factor n=1 Tax=Winogradskyella sp. J14-2 TaxID=1936080 RepID=UPI000972B08B|nr:response regulator [Winogradskyella sp. J14-2]APY08656.1 hypothetical protein BWZ20_10230 [Winogradskyella sp. J14-2]